jgi:hypothetical protein
VVLKGPSAAESVELIRSGIRGLASCDVDGAAAGLGAECEELLRLVGGLQMQVARRLARFRSLHGPAEDGAPSLTAWLGHRARLRPWEARQLATLAARFHLISESVDAFERGEVGFGDVATIAEGIDGAAETMAEGWTPERIAETAQPVLLEAATTVTPRQLRHAASRIALTLDGADAERRRRQIERQSSLDLGQTMDGVGCLRADMGAVDFAIVEKAIDVFAPGPRSDAPKWANRPAHRRLRGLVTACEIALNAAGRSGYRERGGAPVKVHLIATHASTDPNVPVQDAPPGRTEFGTILSAGELRDLIRRRDPQITTVHVDEDGSVTDRFTATGQPLNWGRTKRVFTAAQRDIYLTIYAACAAEGCDRPVAWSAIDHKRAWAAGGRTDLDNGQPLCDWHNQHKQHHRARTDPERQRRKGRAGPTTPADESQHEQSQHEQSQHEQSQEAQDPDP